MSGYTIMQISFELLNEDPKDFQPSYETLSNHTLGSFKVNTLTADEKFPFNSSTKDWSLKIIFDDYKSIKGICSIPTENNSLITLQQTGSINYVPVYFIISKNPINRRKKPVVWQSPFFNQMTQKNFDSLNRFFNDHFDEIIEKSRIYRKTLSMKK